MSVINSKLKNRRKELNLSMKEVAEYVGVSESTVSRWESGNIANMGRDKIYALSKILKISPAEVMGVENEIVFSYPDILPLPPTKKLPLLGTIACGEPILAEENIEEYIDVDEDIKADFVLRCKGQSMIEARIFDGDLVYIHQQADVENGEIAAVLIENEATLKKVYKYPEKEMVILRAANSSFDDLVYSGSELEAVRIIGKAVGFYSKIR